jgi:hypothetical protein
MKMGQQQSRGASGTMELKYHWTESSSTHLETETEVTLSALNDKEIVLTENYEKTNFIRSSDNEASTTRYKISVDALIELIRQQGQRV